MKIKPSYLLGLALLFLILTVSELTMFTSEFQKTCEGEECPVERHPDNWTLGDWSKFEAEVGGTDIANTYLKCGGVYDCNNFHVRRLADEIEAGGADTPKKFIDATARKVHSMIYYQYDGGNAQCGETASSLVKRFYDNGFVTGNCVDYTAVMVAVLRTRGIPARQVAGCVDIHSYCNPFALSPQDLRFGFGQTELGSQEFGHSYVHVWTPEYGFVLSDPTVGKTLSKCVGYKDVIYAGGNNFQYCFIPTYAEQCI